MIRLSLMLFCVIPATAAGPKLSSLDEKPPKEVPQPFAELLDSKAIRVEFEGGQAIDLWIRTEIASTADKDQVKNGLTAREIPETTVLGIIRFRKPFTDYRKQEIPAGVYSLRLAVQPDTGDHKGTAPHAEFAMLSPISKEESPDTMDLKDLVKLSREATGADHPGVMLLMPAKNAKAAAVRNVGTATVLDYPQKVLADGKPVPFSLGLVIDGISAAR